MNRFTSFFAIISVIGGLMLTACSSAVSKKTEMSRESPAAQESESTAIENKNAASQATPETAASREILWDFRKSDYNDQNFSKAETDVVLKYLLGDKRDEDLAITSRVSGSFTKPNARETLYFVAGCKDEKGQFINNSTCGHVAWNSAGWIAIYDGTTPVMKIEEALGGSIEKVTDVNGDGINEFLSFAGYAQSGQQTQGAGLGQISGDKYQKIEGFSGYADNCGSGEIVAADKKAARASVISYVSTKSGKMPEFTQEYFQAACKDDRVDGSSWKTIKKKDFAEFYDSLS